MQNSDMRSGESDNKAHSRRYRLAVVVSHPIQHFVPFYRALARNPHIELRVIYCSSIGLQRYFDAEMNVELAWEMDLLSGYEHVFLPESGRIKRTDFWSVNNPSVIRELDKFQPDVVNVYSYAQLTPLRTLLWCRHKRVPTIMWSDSELLHARAGWRRALKNVVLRSLYRSISGFLTVGDNNEAYLNHYGVGRERMFRTPFTIDEEHFAAVRERREAVRATARNALAIPEEAFVALFVGKLVAHKRPRDLLDAVLSLQTRQGGRPVYALFAGDGPLMGELRALAAVARAPCVFAGFVNVDRLPSIYCTADVLVQPSEKDAHPLVVSEAAFLALPLIVSDRVGSVGPTDTARAGENASIYRCGDVCALARALQQLAGDSSYYRRMSEASRRIATELDIQHSVRGCLEAARAVTARGA